MVVVLIAAEYYDFQQSQEEVIAKVIVARKALTRSAMARVDAKRRALVYKLSQYLKSHQNKLPPYMERLLEKVATGSEEERLRQAAEYVLGLLFAAHKNLAICSSQVICFLLENGDYRARVMAEVLAAKSASEHMAALENAIEETLRLCAHSLGAIRKARGRK